MLELIDRTIINDVADDDVGIYLGLKLQTLSFFAHVLSRQYKIFKIKKRNKRGYRILMDPPEGLKRYQRFLNDVFSEIELPDYVIGFKKGHNIIDAVKPHEACKVACSIDIKDFFPSLNERFLDKFFITGEAPYEELHKELKALLREILRNSFKRFHQLPEKATTVIIDKILKHLKSIVSIYKDYQLPQGAPTSPVLANILFSPCDIKIKEIADKYNLVYTRYADDLIFSSKEHVPRETMDKFIEEIKQTIEDFGLKVNPKKVKVHRAPGQIKSLGVVLNEKLTPSKYERRKMRAILHNIYTNGWDNEARKYGAYSTEQFYKQLLGTLNWWCQIDKERFEPTREQLKTLWKNYKGKLKDEKLFQELRKIQLANTGVKTNIIQLDERYI